MLSSKSKPEVINQRIKKTSQFPPLLQNVGK